MLQIYGTVNKYNFKLINPIKIIGYMSNISQMLTKKTPGLGIKNRFNNHLQIKNIFQNSLKYQL